MEKWTCISLAALLTTRCMKSFGHTILVWIVVVFFSMVSLKFAYLVRVLLLLCSCILSCECLLIVYIRVNNTGESCVPRNRVKNGSWYELGYYIHLHTLYILVIICTIVPTTTSHNPILRACMLLPYNAMRFPWTNTTTKYGFFHIIILLL